MFRSTRQFLAALRDPALGETVRRYYRNTLAAAGVPVDSLEQLTRDQLIDAASRLHRWLLAQAARGTRKAGAADRLSASFRERLTAFADRDELRSIRAWLGRFGRDLGEGHDALRRLDADLGEPLSRWVAGFSEAQILTLALGVSPDAALGLSRAAVFMKLLCRDAGYFTDFQGAVGCQELFVPSDRTNLGTAAYLLSSDPAFTRICPPDVLAQMAAHPRSDEALFRLSFVAHELLGSDAVELEKIWFIGHYYHGMGIPAAGGAAGRRGRPGTPSVPPCAVDSGLIEQDNHLFAGIGVPVDCPFKAAGCVARRIEPPPAEAAARKSRARRPPKRKRRPPGLPRPGPWRGR